MLYETTEECFNKGAIIIEDSHEKPTTNITPSGENLDAFPGNSGTEQGYSLLPLLLNIVLAFWPGKSSKKTN